MRFFDEEGQARAAIAAIFVFSSPRYFSNAARSRISIVVSFFLPCSSFLLDLLEEALRARRIVEIENGSLREGVGRAAAGRMQRVAFDLNRTSIDRADHERQRAGPPRHGGRVVKRFARNRPFHAFR